MDGPDGTLNEEKEKIITAFNAIVREAASSLPGAVLSDHHDFMQGAQYIIPSISPLRTARTRQGKQPDCSCPFSPPGRNRQRNRNVRKPAPNHEMDK